MFGNNEDFEEERRRNRKLMAPLLTASIKDKHYYKDYYLEEIKTPGNEQ